MRRYNAALATLKIRSKSPVGPAICNVAEHSIELLDPSSAKTQLRLRQERDPLLCSGVPLAIRLRGPPTRHTHMSPLPQIVFKQSRSCNRRLHHGPRGPEIQRRGRNGGRLFSFGWASRPATRREQERRGRQRRARRKRSSGIDRPALRPLRPAPITPRRGRARRNPRQRRSFEDRSRGLLPPGLAERGRRGRYGGRRIRGGRFLLRPVSVGVVPTFSSDC